MSAATRLTLTNPSSPAFKSSSSSPSQKLPISPASKPSDADTPSDSSSSSSSSKSVKTNGKKVKKCTNAQRRYQDALRKWLNKNDGRFYKPSTASANANVSICTHSRNHTRPGINTQVIADYIPALNLADVFDAEYAPPPPSSQRPFGMKNNGNTCYMAASIQAFFATLLLKQRTDIDVRQHKLQHLTAERHNKVDTSRRDIARCSSCLFCTMSDFWIAAAPDVLKHGNILPGLSKAERNAYVNVCGNQIFDAIDSMMEKRKKVQKDTGEAYSLFIDRIYETSCINEDMYREFGQVCRQSVRYTKTCHECSGETDKYEACSVIPLQVVHNDRHLKDLDACIAAHCRLEKLEDDVVCVSSYCDKEKQPTSRQAFLCTESETLVFMLVVFGSDMTRIATTVKPELELDISTYVHPDVSESRRRAIPNDLIYDLYATVCHLTSDDSTDLNTGGHYIAFVKIENKWYKCNDSLITVVDVGIVLSKVPYLIFYHHRT